MCNIDNGVIGSDQIVVMIRLVLDELIDQFLYSNVLLLKLMVNLLVVDRVWYFIENICICVFFVDDLQVKKCVYYVLFIFYQFWFVDLFLLVVVNQFYLLFFGIRNYIEFEWLWVESKCFYYQRLMFNVGNIVDELCVLCQQYLVFYYLLFDFFVSEVFVV